MLCRLCLLDGFDVIDMFSETGIKLKISKIIKEHFWFELHMNDLISTSICNICWRKIFTFHEYYETIKEAQQKFLTEPIIKEENNTMVAINSGRLEITNYSEKSGMENEYLPDKIVEKEIFLENTLSKGENNISGNRFKSNLNDNVESQDMSTGKQSQEVISQIGGNPRIKRRRKVMYSPVDRKLSRRQKGSERNSLSEENQDIIECLESFSSSTNKKSLKVFGGDLVPQTSPSSKTYKGVKTFPSSSEKKNARKKEISKNSPKSDENKDGFSEYSQKYREDDEKIANNMKLKCDLCAEECKTFTKIKKHCRDLHNVRGYVVCCSKKFFKRQLLLDHINKHLNPEDYRCKKCNKMFSDKQCLKYHELIYHETDESKIFKCSECPRKFIRQPALDRHKEIHVSNDERNFSCTECGRKYVTKDSLEKHIKRVHETKEGRVCHICAKVIQGISLFERHLLEHSGVTLPRVQCERCGIWLKDSNILKKHIKNQHEGGSKTCTMCGLILSSVICLRSHMRDVHAPERRFACHICGKTYARQSKLRDHMVTHTGEVFTCPYCPHTFGSRGGMENHRKTIHKDLWEEEKRKRYFPTQANNNIPDDLNKDKTQPNVN